MKTHLFIFCCLFFLAAKSQTPYTSTLDRDTWVLNGILTKYALANNDTFKWFQSSTSNYKGDTSLIAALQNAKEKVHFVIFGGTWCEDTQNILPKFFKSQESGGFPDNRVTFYGVDRSKKTIGGITSAFAVTNVPTIIVMKDGKEAGRIVEYGKTGQWEKELAEILRQL